MHPLFDALRRHYGDFRAVPLALGYKEGKGKVENPFGYVEGNFPGQSSSLRENRENSTALGNFLLEHRRAGFASIDDLNEKAALWLRTTAWVRKHGTVQELQADRIEIERLKLKALPAHRFEAAEIVERLVGDDFCVAWDTHRSSVPPRFVGHSAMLRVQNEVYRGPIAEAHPATA